MNIEDQVVSVEVAKKLKEIGVEQESLFYWRVWNDETVDCAIGYEDYDFSGAGRKIVERISAFTVAELMEQLPAVIETKAGRYRLTIEKYEHLWYVSYIGTAGDALETILNKKLADALGEMLIWLVERGYVEVE